MLGVWAHAEPGQEKLLNLEAWAPCTTQIVVVSHVGRLEPASTDVALLLHWSGGDGGGVLAWLALVAILVVLVAGWLLAHWLLAVGLV